MCKHVANVYVKDAYYTIPILEDQKFFKFFFQGRYINSSVYLIDYYQAQESLQNI